MTFLNIFSQTNIILCKGNCVVVAVTVVTEVVTMIGAATVVGSNSEGNNYDPRPWLQW